MKRSDIRLITKKLLQLLDDLIKRTTRETVNQKIDMQTQVTWYDTQIAVKSAGRSTRSLNHNVVVRELTLPVGSGSASLSITL